METYFVFIVKASCCLSLFYLVSLVLFRNNHAFKLQRFYLLASIFISLALPFNQFSIDFSKKAEAAATLQQQPVIQGEHKTSSEPVVVKTAPQTQPIQHEFPLTTVLGIVYWVVAAVLFLRIGYSLIYIVAYFIRSERIKEGKYTIIFHPSISSSFSFLRWIFIHGDIKDTSESQSIIKHEIVHANQFHSLDVFAVELLTAVMWFNPLIWLMRRGMQQLHEYLADEGVLRSGTNVLEYQALLVNQVAGDRLICLPSGFNQSLIKKRLVMMTKPSINRKTGYRLMALIPLAGFMFLILSFTNKKEVSAEKKQNHSDLNVYNQLKPERAFYASAGKQDSNPMDVRDTIKDNGSNGGLMPPPPPPPLKSKTPTSVKSPTDMVTAVSPTKMNVFYLGADNPVNIAVSGVPADKIFPSISNGIIQKMGNNYVVHPQKLGMAVINVTAEIEGKKVHAGTMEFRVKRIPDPVAKVADRKGGIIDKNSLLTQMIVQVDLENFDFDARFVVTEFKVTGVIKGVKQVVSAKSNKITDEQKALIKEVSVGDYIYFQDIKAVGPDGLVRELSPIAFTIKE